MEEERGTGRDAYPYIAKSSGLGRRTALGAGFGGALSPNIVTLVTGASKYEFEGVHNPQLQD